MTLERHVKAVSSPSNDAPSLIMNSPNKVPMYNAGGVGWGGQAFIIRGVVVFIIRRADSFAQRPLALKTLLLDLLGLSGSVLAPP